MSNKQTNPHVYDAISSIVDGADEAARQREAKWGVGRLELLVNDELRTKFRRQVRRFNEAITDGDVERVRQSGAAMRRGWEALDHAATKMGAKPIDPEIWEINLSDGRVVALCKTLPDAFATVRSGRYVDVWTVEEIARLIEKFPEIVLAKETFPGVLVQSVRAKQPAEPLDDEDFDRHEVEGEPIPEGVRF